MAAPPEEDAAKELERVTDKLAVVRPTLRKAEAFSLPEKNALKSEVSDLEARAAALKKKLEPASSPAPAPAPASAPAAAQASPAPAAPPSEEDKKFGGLTRDGKKMSQWTDEDWETFVTLFEDADIERRFDLIQAMGPDAKKRVAEIAKGREKVRQEEAQLQEALRVDKNRKAAQELRSKISFESVQRMSNEERLELAKELGPSYITSLTIVAISFWTIGLPILAYFYHDATGKWLDIFSLFSLDSMSMAGGFVATIFGMYALLKPARLVLALFLTPWTMENITPYMPWVGMEEAAPDQGNSADGQKDAGGKK